MVKREVEAGKHSIPATTLGRDCFIIVFQPKDKSRVLKPARKNLIEVDSV